MGYVTWQRPFQGHFVIRRHSPFPYVFSFRIFGDLENHTLLERLGPTESEKQCLHFFQAPYGRNHGFSKWRLFFSEIWQYVSF